LGDAKGIALNPNNFTHVKNLAAEKFKISLVFKVLFVILIL